MKNTVSTRVTIFTDAVPTNTIRLKKKFRPRKDGLIRLSINGSLDTLFYDTKRDTYLLKLFNGKEFRFKENLTPSEIEGYYFIYQYYEEFDHLEHIFESNQFICQGTLINVFEDSTYIKGKLNVFEDGVIADRPHAKVTSETKFRYLYLYSYVEKIDATFTNYINVEMKGSLKYRYSPETILNFMRIPVEEVFDKEEVFRELRNFGGNLIFWIDFFVKHPELASDRYFPAFEPVDKTLANLFEIILSDQNIVLSLFHRIYDEKDIWRIIPGKTIKLIYNGEKIIFKDMSNSRILYSKRVVNKDNKPSIVANLNEYEFELLTKYINHAINFVDLPKIYKIYVNSFKNVTNKIKIEEVSNNA